MANSVSEVLLTRARLEGAAGPPSPSYGAGGTAASTAQGVDMSAGAVVDFWGVVRKLEGGREIEGIEYEAHNAMAEHQLQLVADAAAAKFQLKRVIAHHRVGFVRAGEASLFLQVSAQHRAAAFEASKWIVDELKRKVPIWKRPAFGPSRTGTEATARQADPTTAMSKSR